MSQAEDGRGWEVLRQAVADGSEQQLQPRGPLTKLWKWKMAVLAALSPSLLCGKILVCLQTWLLGKQNRRLRSPK